LVPTSPAACGHLFCIPPGEEVIVTARRAAFLVGRTLFGGYFLYSGIRHFTEQATLVEYARSKSVPAPDAAIPATGGMLIAGGASVLAGVAPRWGLTTIVAFLAAVTPSIHRFWEVEDPNQRMSETVNFSKNVALAAACLMMMEIPEPWNDGDTLEYDLEVELADESAPGRLLVA
jgi:uncharacterized membrane protein YphA (DoxX/SURF4 family)